MMKARMKSLFSLMAVLALFGATQSASASQVMLFSETFDDVNSGFNGNDPRRLGVPTSATFDSDENWYGARFEAADDGTVPFDVGVQAYGGGGNNSQTGLVEDDAGLLFQVDASLYTNVILKLDWRTFSAGAGDRLRIGYFVGDITAGNAGFDADRSIDLRDASQGGSDGDFNWGAGWTELASFGPNNTFTEAMFDLTDAAGESSVWIAVWLDGGEGDYGKIDNIMVFAEQVPVPAAVWLFASAFAGLVGFRRRS